MLNARLRLRQRSCTRCMVEGVARSRREDNMNNFTSNPKGTPRQRARGKQTRGCEPSSLKLSLLFPILSVTDGDTIRTYTYHADGQLATDSYSGDGRALSPRAPQTETFFSSGESFRSPFPVPHSPFFTGKPMVEGLGHAFWMRNYRAGLAKWQTADPLGYPEGWNQLTYCNNGVTRSVDLYRVPFSCRRT